MKILIIGDIFIDTHMDISDQKINRIGGIFHSVRALNALNMNCEILYCGSSFMEEHIKKYEKKLGILQSYKCFDRRGSPGIFLVKHSNELHSNKYEYILPDEELIEFNETLFNSIAFEHFTDVLIFPGTYDLSIILEKLSHYPLNIHIDMQYEDFEKLEKYKLDTIFISINNASTLEGTIKYLENQKNWKIAVLKENRGGSCILTSDGTQFEIPAYLFGSLHSVGVGDVYNASYLVYKNSGLCIDDSLVKASYNASLYSTTLSYEKYVESLLVLKDYVPLKSNGTRVPFEKRTKFHIYVAGPDFNGYKYKMYFDKISEILSYHNFNGHFPIRENGDGNGKDKQEQSTMYKKDIELLEQCQIMIACGFENDSGTMAEIGYFKAQKKPIILFDPTKDVTNMFVRHTVTDIVYSLDDLLDTVYRFAGKEFSNE